jgi:pyruvate formate lyase activating enzyme
MVTNGYINQEPLQALLPYLSAMNIDLKSIRNEFYDRNCGGSLSPILETIKTAAKHCHIELTNLIITEENDSDKDIAELIDFVASVDKRIPLHFSRYYPCYKLKNPPTDPQRLHYAYELARSRLHHVYVGNLPFNNALICENCHRNLGKRGYGEKLNLKDGKCSYCGHRNYGIWQT